MTSARIGTEHESLTLTRDDTDNIVDTVIANLRSGALTASAQVVHSYASGFTELVAFFESLSQAWRGWDGERRSPWRETCRLWRPTSTSTYNSG